MTLEVIWIKSKDVKDGINTKTFVVDMPHNYNAKVSRIHVDADFESCVPIGVSSVSVKVNGFNAGTIGTKTFPNYFLDPIEFDVPIKNGINTVEFNVREQGCDKVTIYADIFYEIAPEENPVTPPPEFDQCKTCKQQGKLCDGKRCIDNIGKNTTILNKV